MKQHKILEDLGFKRHDIPENYNELIPCKRAFARPDDTRLHKWKLERKTYGFDERETWNLDRSFAYWLLERLIRYQELVPVDMEAITFRYKGKLITQKEACEKMINAATCFLKNNSRMTDGEESWKTLVEVWAISGASFWW